MVEATFSYLAAMREKPTYYLVEPPPDTPWRNTKGDRRRIAVRDARALAPPASLDREGFALVRLESEAGDLSDGRTVRERYFPEVCELVRKATGAERVHAFDHNVRRGGEARASGVRSPVRFVHNDYTESSGPQRLRDLFGDEADALLRRRFAVINVWKPIRGPVRANPLAVCDARSIRPDDFIPTDLVYPDRRGEVYSLAWSSEHRWFYYPEMRTDEVLLMKCYDSETGRARYTAHTAFDDPTTPPDAPPRESVEVRTYAIFPADRA